CPFAVLIIRSGRGAPRGLELGRLLGEHAPLLVRVGAHPEDVVVTLRPRERLGERLRRDEEDLVLLRPVRDREADVRQERSRDQGDLLRRHQLLRVLLGLGGLALVVAEDDLDLAAEHTALRVDLVDRHLDRLPVRSGERCADAAERDDLPDPDRRLLRRGRRRRREDHDGRKHSENAVSSYREPPRGAAKCRAKARRSQARGAVSLTGAPSGAKQCVEHAVRAAADWARVRELDPGGGALGRELEAVRLIVRGRHDDAPVLHTVFTPLTIAKKLAGDRLRDDLRAAPAAVEGALETITRTMTRYANAALDAGADGLFVATQTATRGRGPVRAIADEVDDAVRQTGGRGVIVAPGCVLPLDVPEAHLDAVVDAVKRSRP